MLKESQQIKSHPILINTLTSNEIQIPDLLSFGQNSSNHVQINDKEVCPRHARIEKLNDKIQIRDLKSKSGTFLNGTAILLAPINNGDRIRIGRTEFIFRDQPQKTASKDLNFSQNIYWNQQLKRLPLVSKTDHPVLILGESGTGKELIARAVHNESHRSSGPFFAINCSALSESLIESELFGHIKGSYTGATSNRSGAFEAARSGTLFLDEIGELPLHLQPKLLRAIDNREIRPVGSDHCIHTDTRIVAATHQKLSAKVKNGEFRMDLYNRLNVIKIQPPALKSRMEDFETLLYTFCKDYKVSFSFNAIQELKKYSWPGNIRELKNYVARTSAIVIGRQAEPQDVYDILEPLIDSNRNNDEPFLKIQNEQNESMICSIEKRLIIETLIKNNGNQRKVANALKLPKSTLHDRIKRYEINVKKILEDEYWRKR